MSFSRITQPICLFDNMRMRRKYQLSFFRIAFESLPTLHSVALIVNLYEHTLASFTFVSVFFVSLSILFSLFLQRYWLSCGRVEVALSVAASYYFCLPICVQIQHSIDFSYELQTMSGPDFSGIV